MPENVTLTSSSLTPLPPEVCDWQRKESLRSDSQWAFTSLPGTGRSILLSAVQVAARRERGSYWYQIIADYKSRYRGRVFPSSSLPSFLPSFLFPGTALRCCQGISTQVPVLPEGINRWRTPLALNHMLFCHKTSGYILEDLPGHRMLYNGKLMII